MAGRCAMTRLREAVQEYLNMRCSLGFKLQETGRFFPNARAPASVPNGVHYLLVKHVKAAAHVGPSLKGKRVTAHRLRHTMAALDLLQGGVDRSVIASWLGHA